MFDILPADIIRKIFNYIFEECPLYIFMFIDSWFEYADYTPEEKENLIKKCIIDYYEKTNIPLFQNNEYIHLLYKNTFMKNLYILDSIESKVLYDENFKINFPFLSDNFQLCEWLIKRNIKVHENCLFNAILDNNFILIKWIHSNKLCNFEMSHIQAAVTRNDLEFLKWLCSVYPNFKFDDFCIYKSILNDNFEMLKFICEEIERHDNTHIYQFYAECYCACIRFHDLEMLKYIYYRDVNIYLESKNACFWEAISSCNLKILKWLLVESFSALKSFKINQSCIELALTIDDFDTINILSMFPNLSSIEKEDYLKICKSEYSKQFILNLK
jgi:predicted nucleic acid-binding OB-fold protein